MRKKISFLLIPILWASSDAEKSYIRKIAKKSILRGLEVRWVELKSNKLVDQPGIQPEHSIIPVDEKFMCFIVLKSPERNCCSFFFKTQSKKYSVKIGIFVKVRPREFLQNHHFVPGPL